jgi:tRNA-dihydrouridine synthase B
VEFKGEKYGVMEFRKHYSGYLREFSNISQIRLELMKFTEYAPIEERLLRFKKEFCD